MSEKTSFEEFVGEIERKSKESNYRTSIKNCKSKLIDYLTPELCSRLEKCIDMKSISELQKSNSIIDTEIASDTLTENDDGNEYDVEDNAIEYETLEDSSREQLEVNFQPTSKSRKSIDLQRSWMANYLLAPRNDRIMWESKLYKFERSYSGKSLPDKTEELMDLAVGDFADWLKSLGSDGKVNMTKDLIKNLFSIGIEEDAAKKALFVAPVIKSAIPEEIANIVRLPDLAIERNVEKIMLEDKRLVKIEPKYVSFGRTLPPALKLTKFEIEDRINKPNFPVDLRTNKILFDGITHLRSTKMLMEYLDKQPQIPKPTFLEEGERKQSIQSGVLVNKSNHTPLYKIVSKSRTS